VNFDCQRTQSVLFYDAIDSNRRRSPHLRHRSLIGPTLSLLPEGYRFAAAVLKFRGCSISGPARESLYSPRWAWARKLPRSTFHKRNLISSERVRTCYWDLIDRKWPERMCSRRFTAIKANVANSMSSWQARFATTFPTSPR